MARIRSLKPEFWQDTKVSKLPALDRLVFLCTWSMADDQGRFEADAEEVWRWGRFVEDSREIARSLERLRGLGRLALYEVDGNPYVQITNFVKHQKIDHPSKSKCPSPSEGKDLFSATESRGLDEQSRDLARDHGSWIKDHGSRIMDHGSGTLLPSSAQKRAGHGGLNGHDTAATWDAYASAYEKRYGVQPVRNKSVNSQILAFVKRIGVFEAPIVAEFYLGHSRGLYVSAKHAVNLLLRDCEGLRTEWATGKKVTDTSSRQADATQARGEAFTGLLEEAQKREDKG